MLNLFYIFLLIGVLFYLGAFKFKRPSFVLLFFSGLTFFLLGVGLFSDSIQIPSGELDSYSYDNVSKITQIQTTYTYYSTVYSNSLGFLSSLAGLYLLISVVFDFKNFQRGDLNGFDDS